MTKGIERMFKHEQDQPWRTHVEQVAEKLTEQFEKPVHMRKKVSRFSKRRTRDDQEEDRAAKLT